MAQNPTSDPQHHTRTASEDDTKDRRDSTSQVPERNDGSEKGALDVGLGYAERVYETGQRKAEEAAFYAELGYEEARDWARSHPAQALGIAAGIGLLVGILVARR